MNCDHEGCNQEAGHDAETPHGIVDYRESFLGCEKLLQQQRLQEKTFMTDAKKEMEENQRELVQQRDSALAQLKAAQQEVERLRESLSIFVHAHATGNSVPPHLEQAARSILTAPVDGSQKSEAKPAKTGGGE